jgi:arginyl-tRNA synthetase
VPFNVIHPEPVTSQRVVVEFSSPNIAKPFHVGHLRSTVIGNSVSHLHRACGNDVTRLNYLGDWGRQFGLVEYGFNHYGSQEQLSVKPLQHLFDVYVQASAAVEGDPAIMAAVRGIAQDMETALQSATDGNVPAALQLWQQLKAVSLAAYKQSYARLNVAFDHYDAESLHVRPASDMLASMQNEPFIKVESNGALVGEVASLPPFVLQKADGSTTYLARDLAAAVARGAVYQPDVLLYVAGGQQELHFKQLKGLLASSGHAEVAACLEHVGFGLVKGMSTRKGTVVFLDDLLAEVQEHMSSLLGRNPATAAMLDNGSTVAEQLALSAVVVQDLKSRRTKDYSFHWQRMLSTEGDTGTFLQYTHARLASIERKVADADPMLMAELPNLPLTMHEQVDDGTELRLRLLYELSKFESVVLQACAQNEPSLLVHQLFRMARAANSAHAKLRVLDNGRVDDVATLQLFQGARTSLGAGLQLIGLVPLYRV